jgi:hypothetical protein
MNNGKSVFYKAAAGNFVIVVLPIIVAFILAFVFGLARFADATSPFFYGGIGLMAVGWLLLVRSKWDQIRSGEIWTFGVSQANNKMRLLYRLSYAVMIVGYLVSTFSGQL